MTGAEESDRKLSLAERLRAKQAESREKAQEKRAEANANFAERRAEISEKRAESKARFAERKEALAEKQDLRRRERSGEAATERAIATATENPDAWWSGLTKSTVAVNVRYLNVKTPTKSMGVGTFKINPEEGLTWRANLGPKVAIPWSAIESIEIDGERTSRVTLARAATIGVFALGAKKKRTDTTMVVVTPTKEYGFEFEKTEPLVVRNKMRPVLAALAAATGPATEAPSQSTPVVDVADQLLKFAALRDQGIINDEEFAAQKAKLLDQ